VGPIALSRAPSRAYAVTGRLDILAEDQRRAVLNTTRFGDLLSVQEARKLLATIVIDDEGSPWHRSA
jgi:hypothetical protein